LADGDTCEDVCATYGAECDDTSSSHALYEDATCSISDANVGSCDTDLTGYVDYYGSESYRCRCWQQ
jgi:hypothetical protein